MVLPRLLIQVFPAGVACFGGQAKHPQTAPADAVGLLDSAGSEASTQTRENFLQLFADQLSSITPHPSIHPS